MQKYKSYYKLAIIILNITFSLFCNKLFAKTSEIPFQCLSPSTTLPDFNDSPEFSLLCFINGIDKIGNQEIKLKPVVISENKLNQSVFLSEGNLTGSIDEIKSINNKKVILIPFENNEHKFIYLVFDFSEYQKKGISIIPDSIYLRNIHFKKLIPEERYVYYQIKESLERGLINLARTLTSNSGFNLNPDEFKSNPDLFNNSDVNKSNFPDSFKLNHYLTILADFPSLKEKQEALDFFIKFFSDEGNVKSTLNFFSEILDRTDYSIVQMHFNVQIIKLLSLLPDKYKTVEISRITSKFVFYKGRYYKNEIKNALENYFNSIPDSVIFFRNNKRSSSQKMEINPDVLDDIILDEIRTLPLLNHLGEIKFSALSKLGNTDARNQLIQSNLKFVSWMADQYTKNTNFSKNALFSEGTLGLIRAAEKFDPTRGIRFISYASWHVKQKMERFLKDNRNLIRLPAHFIEKMNVFRSKCIDMQIDLNTSQLSPYEIAETLDMTLSEVEEFLSFNYLFLSLDSPVLAGEDDGTSLYELLEIKTDDNIETAVIDSIWSEKLIEKIREAIKKKWKKTIDQDRAIIIFEQRILNDQDTLDNLGIKYNVSKERIRQVEKTIISIIKDVLHKGNFLTGTSYENYTEPLETHKKSKTTKVNTST